MFILFSWVLSRNGCELCECVSVYVAYIISHFFPFFLASSWAFGWLIKVSIFFLFRTKLKRTHTIHEIVVHFSYSLSLLFAIVCVCARVYYSIHLKIVNLFLSPFSPNWLTPTDWDIEFWDISSDYKINKFHLHYFRHNHKTTFYTLLCQFWGSRVLCMQVSVLMKLFLAMKPFRKHTHTPNPNQFSMRQTIHALVLFFCIDSNRNDFSSFLLPISNILTLFAPSVCTSYYFIAK